MATLRAMIFVVVVLHLFTAALHACSMPGALIVDIKIATCFAFQLSLIVVAALRAGKDLAAWIFAHQIYLTVRALMFCWHHQA